MYNILQLNSNVTIETHHHKIKRGMNVRPGIKVWCANCINDEREPLFLVEHLDETGPNHNWARGVAEFHDERHPSHLVVIATFNLPN